MRCFCTKIRTHHCKVVLLDEQELIQEIQDTSRGQEVLDTVYRHLNLLETAYFGLRYIDTSNQTHWLDTTKKVVKQLKGKETFTLYFGVKFYAADPCKLLEEITRYQFFLQVKQDILQGRLPVAFDLAAELGAFVVQSELGDYDPRRHSPGYVSEFRFLSNQSVDLESKIAELHKEMLGQLPSVAELNYLDKVKWLEMYGVDLHPVLGEDNVEYFLGLTPTGVIVLRNKNKVASYFWPRITKIYFKGRYFMLRVCDKNNDENTYGFETPSKPACKHLYKCCVEHHAFFRLVQVSPNPPDIIGTRFSSGRAEKISQREAQMRLRSPPQFTRTPSRRYQRRIVEGAQDSPKIEEIPKVNKENIPPQETKTVSVPQPVHSVSSLYRGTSIVPSRCDSPRSTRSAPWTTGPPSRGLYSGSSPRSVRSSGNTRTLAARRSSSVESHSSNDSRSCRRHRHHRSRRGSDNESELSRCSGKSRRHRHRSRRSSGSEHESRHHRSSSKHRYELVESEGQWKEVQRRQAEGGSGVHQATVISNKDSRPRSGYMNSGMETESEHSYHHRRKHRKHRSRSRSPSETKSRLPEELKQHLEFQLVETDGMSESQLREIPYKVVETNTAKAVRVRLSPSSKRRQHSARRVKSCSLKEEELPSTGDSPPPPYSETPATNTSTAVTTATQPDGGPAADLTNNKNSSNNHNSSSNQLPRMAGTALLRQSESANNRSLCSALYGNPATLLGSTHQNINRRESLDNTPWMSADQHTNNKGYGFTGQQGNSSGTGLWKQDLPPRNYPLNSMRQPPNISGGIQKPQWVGPEVRGTVGLPWPTGANQGSPSVHRGAADSAFFAHQTPPQNFNTLPENFSRRPSQEGFLGYSGKSNYNGNSEQHQSRTNVNNNSQDFLQGSANSLLNYPGTPPSHLRPSRSTVFDHANGNVNDYESPSPHHNHNNHHHHHNLHQPHHPSLNYNQSNSYSELNRTVQSSESFQINVRQSNGTTDPALILRHQKGVISSSSSSLQSNSNTNTSSRSRSNLSVDQNNANSASTAHNKSIDREQTSAKAMSPNRDQLVNSTGDVNGSASSISNTKWTTSSDLGTAGHQENNAQDPSSNKSSWGPLYFQKKTDSQNNAATSKTPETEVNNNPRIVHEMSTEL